MSKIQVIEVTVSGPTQTGKSVIMSEIKKHLEHLNLAVIYSDRADRLNPPDGFAVSPAHARPNEARTVIVLNEVTDAPR